jgi:RHS repeat-associated protein
VTNGVYRQSNAALSNTNAYRGQTQGQGTYIFRWVATFNSGTSAGFYLFASAGTGAERGNSYRIWQDATSVKIYENVNDVATQRASFPAANAAGQTNTYQVTYDTRTGQIAVWRAGGYLGSWTDTTPLTSGAYLSLRTDNADVSFDSLIVLSVVKYYYSGGQRIALRRDGVVSYLLTDQLGSTRVTTGESGAWAAEMKYYPFGWTRYNSGGQKTTYRFTGQRYGPGGGGLYDYGARWYDSTIGRFIQADTIVPQPGNPQALNRYSYVGNRPTVYVDPTGHAHVCGTDADGGGCGEWSVYTHSIVENPLVVVDPELLEQAQAVSAATKAEMQAGIDRASAEARRIAKRAVKEQIRHEIKKSLPPSGAVSIGACGVLGVAKYGTACGVLVAADSKGNINVFGGGLGGGAVMIFTVGIAGNVTWLPGATDVSQLGGVAVNVGISVGEGIVGGADWVISPQIGGEYLHGISINLGFGAKDAMAVIPGEFHVGATRTWLSPIRFNIYKLYESWFSDW